jgi:2-polyprenyl-3-methyl-5-hydroxy-6-metoxy-1,4-benzoquinol methylase
MSWIARHATEDAVTVLDLGGRDLNGSPKHLFPNATKYYVLDILPGDDVDVVADAANWQPDEQYDYVLSAECFEHTASWPAICRTAHKALKPGGAFIVTTAGPGRPPHSAIDGLFHLHPGEHYANVPAFELERVLRETGFRDIVVDSQPSPADTRAVATR